MTAPTAVPPRAPLPAAPGAGAASPRAERDRQLRDVARQLEGVFVAQLYQAMRASVPRQEGIVSGGTGEEMFTALMDQHLAAETPEHWASGLADAIHRQLRGRALAGLPDDPAGAATAIAAPAPTPDPIAAR